MKLMRIVRWTLVVVPLALLALGLVAYWRSTNACNAPRPGPPTNPMRAVVYCDYGSPDVLKVEAIEKPVPADGQVLIRVRAAAVNPLDWHYMRGTPYVMRLDTGLRKPKVTRLGVDFAGTVEAVGPNVTRFKPGDDVFGGRTGALGEYVTMRETALALKPANLTFEQAAAVPIAAITALQGLRDKGKVRARAEGADQRRVRRRGHLRRADRQGVRRRGDRRLQHAERRDGALARRRSCHRLHQRGFHQERRGVTTSSSTTSAIIGCGGSSAC